MEHPQWEHIKKQEASGQYLAIEKFCSEIDPSLTCEKLYNETQQFAAASETIGKELEVFSNALAKISLSSLILLWSQSMAKDRALGARNLSMMNELLVSKVLPLATGNKLTMVKEMAALSHASVVDKIRCYSQWPIQMREDYVSFYLDFANWLSASTFGFIPPATDPDRNLTASRQLPHATFIKLITHLPDRERILAKLFYLGGERSLEEVLSVKIEDISLQSKQITYEKYLTNYPQHVICDILEYVGSRKTGFVFINKDGERLNHTVPYRALKSAAQKLNLPSSFTFKDLVRDC